MKLPRQHRPRKVRETKPDAVPRLGLARVLSKWGLCSRTVAAQWIRAGRVAVDGRIVRDPEAPQRGLDLWISIDGIPQQRARRQVLMLHKKRGVVVSRSDERGRPTVFADIPQEPWLAPIGRLDRASSGLLLFSNDPIWSQRLLDPAGHLPKTYRVQIRPPLAAEALHHIATASVLDGRPCLPMEVRAVACGGKTQWLEFVLQEGRNRQIRRLLEAQGVEVLRLIRIAFGSVILGDLAPGSWRWLSEAEITALESMGNDELRKTYDT
nr:pseudouridine synthase [Acidithiobacillus caldus]